MSIDIKPGSDLNSINLGSNGTIPVAIFSTVDFDATTVDPLTVTLADASVKVKRNREFSGEKALTAPHALIRRAGYPTRLRLLPGG